MRGGLLCQAGRSNDLHKASGLENLFKPNAMKLASMAEVQPSLCNYPNPRAHWPKVTVRPGDWHPYQYGPRKGPLSIKGTT